MAKKDVTAIVSGAGWLASFAEKLIKELRNRGVSDEQIHQLVTDKGDVPVGKIAEMLAGTMKKATSAFQAVVNYDRSVSLGIQAGKYNWTNDNIADKHFPPEKGESGSEEISFELVHLNKVVSSDEVLKELKSRNLRPATLRELLAFGEKYPDEQRKYPVVALGSVWRDFYGDRLVPCLCSGRGGRDLGLFWCDGDWNGGYRFLGVRK